MHTILEFISNLHPRLINELQDFFAEIQHISLLWEEEWHNLLLKLQNDVGRFAFSLSLSLSFSLWIPPAKLRILTHFRKLLRLEEEGKRIRGNAILSDDERAHLMETNYSSVLKSSLAQLEKLLEKTRSLPTSDHEAWFQKTFLPQIQGAFQALKQPKEYRNLKSAWAPFKNVITELQKILQRPRTIPVTI